VGKAKRYCHGGLLWPSEREGEVKGSGVGERRGKGGENLDAAKFQSCNELRSNAGNSHAPGEFYEVGSYAPTTAQRAKTPTQSGKMTAPSSSKH